MKEIMFKHHVDMILEEGGNCHDYRALRIIFLYFSSFSTPQWTCIFLSSLLLSIRDEVHKKIT